MSFYTEISTLENENMLVRQNRVGILGGTFNPIHNGHISMAKISLYEFSLGEVIFIPTGLPPHKKDEYIAPSESRCDMIKLAIKDEKRFSLSQMELLRSGYTYTVDTMEILTRENKNNEYYYIVGADTLFELKTWKNFERVICLTNFICVLRPGQNDNEVNNYADILNNRYGYKFFVAKEKGPDISSSNIRDMSAGGMPVRGLVPESVADYIAINNVYLNEA
jgi:nicotinate-nucleotide adenylyltransferase